MGLLFQVGEQSQFPPVPPKFPTCGNWNPVEAVAEDPKKRNAAETFPASFCMFILMIFTYHIIIGHTVMSAS